MMLWAILGLVALLAFAFIYAARLGGKAGRGRQLEKAHDELDEARQAVDDVRADSDERDSLRNKWTK